MRVCAPFPVFFCVATSGWCALICQRQRGRNTRGSIKPDVWTAGDFAHDVAIKARCRRTASCVEELSSARWRVQNAAVVTLKEAAVVRDLFARRWAFTNTVTALGTRPQSTRYWQPPRLPVTGGAWC